ncbi:hypothetical protein JST97_02225 [bacterium]|nr:hypothetical protein [bacterium]
MLTLVEARSILTRSSGYLKSVCSHSLNPYRGCSLGRSLCGVACYVQHNRFLTQGRPWGSFLEGKSNAGSLYLAEIGRERRRGPVSIFMSSATDPFPPQERTTGITRSVLEAMVHQPPDLLIVQTHSDLVSEYTQLLLQLPTRVHISIESDRDRLPGLPAPACSVAKRMEAGRTLRRAGLMTVACLSPLIPIREPEPFFERLKESFDAVILDHFVGGDGTSNGTRTRVTAFPAAIESVQPGASRLEYLHQMVGVARRHFPGRVGVGPEGFAARWLK